MPYLFESNEHAYAVLDSDIGEDLATQLEDEANVKILAWMENGYRHNTNNKRPLHTPADLKGIKQERKKVKCKLILGKHLDANATPMAWTEVYTALQQGVMDSQENPLATIYDSTFYDVQKYLNLTKHVYSPAPLMMSKRLFESLSEEDQNIVIEAAQFALPVQREGSQKQEEEMKTILVEKGMELTEPDLDAFRKAVEPVIEKWAPQIGEELVDSIRNFEY